MRNPDSFWMRRALALARRGLGATQPNPLVGAMILDRNGDLAGRGWHQKAGEAHAEVHALDQAGERAKGGTLYITLEPCCHFGRTPPCAKRIISSGIKRVVIAMLDPNSLVNGKGASELRTAGLDVSIGCMEELARAVNQAFIQAITHQRPFITAKMAISVDGKMGVVGKRIRLSGEAAEIVTMRLRAEAGAIVAGIGTILTDNPKLTVRGKHHLRKPIRAIVDPSLRTPPTARLFSAEGGRIWIFCSKSFAGSPTGKKRRALLEKKKATVIPLKTDRKGLLRPEEIVDYLWRDDLSAVLVEGGATTLRRFATANLVDRWVVYATPNRIGPRLEGRKAVPGPTEEFWSHPIRSLIRRGKDWELVSGPRN